MPRTQRAASAVTITTQQWGEIIKVAAFVLFYAGLPAGEPL
jgi:hypothetical protein